MFFCKFCGQDFSRKDSLKRHGDCRIKPTECRFCGKILKSEMTLRRHISEHHKDTNCKSESHSTSKLQPKKTVNCKFCGNTFTSKRNLKRHGDCRKPTPCRFCGKILISAMSLKRHTIRNHQDTNCKSEIPSTSKPEPQKGFSCKFCCGTFSRKDSLERHGDCRIKPTVCPFCGIILKSETSFKRHIAMEHKDTNGKSKIPSKSTPEPKKPQLVLKNRLFEQDETVKLVKTLWRDNIATYQFSGTEDVTNVRLFMEHLREKVIMLIKESVSQIQNVKIGLKLFGNFRVQFKDKMKFTSLSADSQIVCTNTDLEELFRDSVNILEEKAAKFQEKKSEYSLQQLCNLVVSIDKCMQSELKTNVSNIQPQKSENEESNDNKAAETSTLIDKNKIQPQNGENKEDGENKALESPISIKQEEIEPETSENKENGDHKAVEASILIDEDEIFVMNDINF